MESITPVTMPYFKKVMVCSKNIFGGIVLVTPITMPYFKKVMVCSENIYGGMVLVTILIV
jgi:hypothetical protein